MIPTRHLRFDTMEPRRRFLAVLVLGAVAACAHAGEVRDEQAAIGIARRVVAERESWPHGAEFTARATKDGWTVTAWRIDYPNNPGASRFVPGGFRTITFDRAGKVTQYLPG